MSEVYEASEIVPLPARCKKCGRDWLGKDAIRAPSLRNCCCFWCGGQLRPHPDFPGVIDAATKRRVQRESIHAQLPLNLDEAAA